MDTQKKELAEIFMICRLDLDGSWIEVSARFCELLGYAEDEIKGMNVSEIIHPADRKEGVADFEKLKGEEISDFESKLHLQTKSGESVEVFISGILVRGREGRPEHIVCHIQNLSKQIEVLHKLEEREQQFDSLFKNNPHPVYYFDLEGNFEGVNEKLVEFTGFSREELLKKGFEEFIIEKDLERTQKQFQKAASGNPGQYEIKVVVKDGQERDIRVTKFPKYSGDKVTGVFGILQDITKDRNAKRKLERSEQHFKSLFERNPDAVYSFDVEGNFIQANKALEDLTGYTIEELVQLNFEPIVAPEERERVLGKFNLAAGGSPQAYETSGIRKDGHSFYVQVTNLPIYVDGEIVGVFGIAHDITERKKAEQKLQESEERWQQLLKQNPQPVQIVQDGVIVYINKSGADYYGASPNELIGKPIMDFVHPDDKEKVLLRKNSLEKNEHVEPAENKIMLLNGEERYIEAHSIPIMYKGERAIQTVVHDITDLKEKQEIIGKSLREKETLLKEIHHRVKNNLAMISSMLELQIMQSIDESATTALRDSQLRIRSIAMIHEKLYQNESLHDISFDEYLKELVETIHHTYAVGGTNIQTYFELDPVSLDINQVISCSLIVNEVVVNCFKHAFKNQTGGNLRIFLNFQDPTIELTVIDDGHGLPENFKIDDQQSLGMTLIEALSSQLEGTVSFGNNDEAPGTVFRLKFDKKTED